jgi:hypothetical protein
LRVSLGYLDDVDTFSLEADLFDVKHLL